MPRKIRIVSVHRPIIPPDGAWRVHDQAGEHDETFYPDEWMKACMGARMRAFFEAIWSAEGWQFRRIVRRDLHWDDQTQ